jgi:hypothetical protein
MRHVTEPQALVSVAASNHSNVAAQRGNDAWPQVHFDSLTLAVAYRVQHQPAKHGDGLAERQLNRRVSRLLRPGGGATTR